MKVKLAKTAGFCMGVRRAMEMALVEANKKKGPLYTLGPLIHNRQVLDLLASREIVPLDDSNRIEAGRIVIRAHGIPPQERRRVKDTGLEIIDATCPKVARVQAIIRYHTNKNYAAVIVGDRDHAEVIGLMGYSKTPAYLIQNAKDVSALPSLEQLFVVAQTTQNEVIFRDVVAALKKRFPHILVFDTICEATHQRQQEVRSFAGQVDGVVVVGGYHSGNTQRLAQVSEEVGLPTFHVETEKDLDKAALARMDQIGVAAGASTPNWMISNVVRAIEGLGREGKLSLRYRLLQALRFLTLSNLLIASGAFSFAYAIPLLSGRDPNITFPLVAFFYIYAMHVFNRFLDKGASAYNDPDRAAFLRNHRLHLILSGLAAMAIALILSIRSGIPIFFVLIGLSILGIIYSIPLIPERFRHRHRYTRIKDIPGSRSLAEALAWMAVITLLPLLKTHPILWSASIIGFLIVFSMSYIRATLYNIFQVQGDMIVGTETLPIILGEKKTLLLLKTVLIATAIILLGSPLLGLVGPFSYILLLPLFTLWLCLMAYEKRWLYPGIPLESLVEGNFILAGLLALIWPLMPWQS
ncbi:MAG: 4-hydroxy-3-methylbut-2-enyl diphosphate reductase [Desulfobacteraceae bacterium]|nr:4-hydroxy-3-methylbut-2-enyl diphosphate reductase [Desulfobacteraceae bacterium]